MKNKMYKEDIFNFLVQEEHTTKERFWGFASACGVCLKEVRENWAALNKYKDLLGGDCTVLEIGAGHGLLGTWVAWMGLANVYLVDKRYINKPPKTYTLATKIKPHITQYLHLIACDLNTESTLPAFNTILSVHSCGDLTDYALRLAARKRAKVGVMPCCYNKVGTGAERCGVLLQAWKTGGVPVGFYQDTARAQWLQHQGYSVRLRSIPEHITPMNRIITGVPLSTTTNTTKC